jgi:hypothetical protein
MGDDVVQTDELRSTVSPFHPKEEFRRGGMIVHRDVERALVRNPDLLSEAVATGRKTATRALSYIGHAVCKSL